MPKPRKPNPHATVERVRELFDYDPATGLFTRKQRSRGYPAGQIMGYLDAKGYIRINVDRRSYMAHRLAWLHFHGRWPVDQIDHANRLRTDNRLANLRECDNAENRQNIRPEGYGNSGHVGVHWRRDGGKWFASIGLNGAREHLGSYATKDEAVAAYERRKQELHEFAFSGVSKVVNNVQGR